MAEFSRFDSHIAHLKNAANVLLGRLGKVKNANHVPEWMGRETAFKSSLVRGVGFARHSLSSGGRAQPPNRKNWLTYRDGDHHPSQSAKFFRDVSAAFPDHGAIPPSPAANGVLWKMKCLFHPDGGLLLSCTNLSRSQVKCRALFEKNTCPLGMARILGAVAHTGCGCTITPTIVRAVSPIRTGNATSMAG
jgi:hypothetical protein